MRYVAEFVYNIWPANLLKNKLTKLQFLANKVQQNEANKRKMLPNMRFEMEKIKIQKMENFNKQSMKRMWLVASDVSSSDENCSISDVCFF